MKVGLDIPSGARKRNLLVSCGLLALAPVCFGQTNTAHAAAPSPLRTALIAIAMPRPESPPVAVERNPPSSVEPSHRAAGDDVFWKDAANGYFQEVQRQKLPSKHEESGSPLPRQAADYSNRMNLETYRQAQVQRIEKEGLLQPRAAILEADRKRNLEIDMGALCHHPESLIWGTPLNPLRVLGTGTASGVP